MTRIQKAKLASLLVATVAGAILWGGVQAGLKFTGTEEFCISCHELRESVYREYLETSHHANRTGVRATCPDCHVPKALAPKLARKIEAANDVYRHLMGTIDTPEKFELRRLLLARRVWKRMAENDSRECRSCHDADAMDYVRQGDRAMRQHMEGVASGQTCIDCHKGIAHTLPYGMAEEDAL